MKIQTRQSLPPEDYLVNLGISTCVFNSNISFLIENFMNLTAEETDFWFELNSFTSGQLLKYIKKHNVNELIDSYELINMRNRIVHSFQATVDKQQILISLDTKTKEQILINNDYLKKFIEMNERLCGNLYKIRGY